jgi:hypothetical protein
MNKFIIKHNKCIKLEYMNVQLCSFNCTVWLAVQWAFKFNSATLQQESDTGKATCQSLVFLLGLITVYNNFL